MWLLNILLAGMLLGVAVGPTLAANQDLSPSGSAAGIGFALPIATVRRVVPQLIAQGRYAHPYLGVQTLDIGPNQAEFLRQSGLQVPVDQGLLVVGVVSRT